MMGIVSGLQLQSLPAVNASFQRRVLVIEAHTDLRTMLHSLLDFHRWFVMSTARGSDAVTLARGMQPQLIMLDMQLGDVSALLLARQLRAVCPNVIILGTTTNPLSRIMTAVREAGVDSVLLKPFELDFAELAYLVEPFN